MDQKWYVEVAWMIHKRIPAVFYRNENRREPVREWLLEMSKEERFCIGVDIKTVEYGWPVGMPVCRSMGRGIYEIRTNLTHKIVRVLFTVMDGQMILLHGFIKKSRKTSKEDMDIAVQRKKILEKYQ